MPRSREGGAVEATCVSLRRYDNSFVGKCKDAHATFLNRHIYCSHSRRSSFQSPVQLKAVLRYLRVLWSARNQSETMLDIPISRRLISLPSREDTSQSATDFLIHCTHSAFSALTDSFVSYVRQGATVTQKYCPPDVQCSGSTNKGRIETRCSALFARAVWIRFLMAKLS